MTKPPIAQTGKMRLTSAERRRKAWELRLEGRTLQQIGDELGVTKQAVHRMLQKALDEAAQLNIEAADELRRIEDERLERRFARIIDLMDTYKTNAKTLMELDARLDAISSAKRKLWGLDAPTRTDVTSGGECIEATNEDARDRALAALANAIAAAHSHGANDGDGAMATAERPPVASDSVGG